MTNEKTITVPLSEYVELKAPKAPKAEPKKEAAKAELEALQAKISVLEEEKKQQAETRKKGLLAKLSKTQQETYADATLETLQAIVDITPKQAGIDISPPAGQEQLSVADNMAQKGFTGNYNIRTGQYDLP